MKKIAITGGICSGKSTVCKFIEELGYKVFYSDDEAIKLANFDVSLIEEIVTEFGDEAYIDGIYNRKYIGSIVFDDKAKLDKLNKIFSEHIKIAFNDFRKINILEKVVFYESALIFEHGKENEFDNVICVYADKKVIENRLKDRNGYTDEEIVTRLNSQLVSFTKLLMTPWHINTNNGVNINIVKEILKKVI